MMVLWSLKIFPFSAARNYVLMTSALRQSAGSTGTLFMYSQPNPTNQGKEAGSSSGGQRPSLNSGFTPRVDDFILRQKNHCTLAKPTVNTTKAHDERIANLTFASVYPHYVTKVVRSMDKLVDELAKGRKMEKILRAQ